MQATELLKNYKKQFDPTLEKYFKRKIEKAAKIDPLAKQAVKMIADFTLAGGKRIRPALVYYGYIACGGKELVNIIEASMSIELVHTFLLIHDDIIDKDDRRHGIPTLHESYKKIGKKIAPKKDAQHFGNSMAMIAGDMAASMANEIIFNSQFPPKIIIKALDKLQDIVYVTIPGEMLDVVMEYRGTATEQEILKMYDGKTGRYTFEGPLQLGAVLAGADETTLQNFSEYSLAVGKAFQIRDDILGIFGDEKKLGKPVGSDIIEGKQTLLVVKALEFGDSKERKILKELLGKKDITKQEVRLFQAKLHSTGAYQYCQNLSEKLVASALESLQKINFKNQEAKIFLNSIANYIIERQQ